MVKKLRSHMPCLMAKKKKKLDILPGSEEAGVRRKAWRMLVLILKMLNGNYILRAS